MKHIQKGARHAVSNMKAILLENSKQSGAYKELDGVVLAEEASRAQIEGLEEFTSLSRSSKGLILLSTSLLCRLVSSRIIDNADLQVYSLLNARVHLPSTKAFLFTLPKAVILSGSEKDKVDGRIRRCNHLACLSSILG